MPRGRRGWRGGRDGPGYPRRISGLIEPALLLLLRQGPTHGYGLMSGLADIGFEHYPIDSSTIYRILREMEARRLILSDWEADGTAGPPRRVYRITPEGEEYLAAWTADLRATERLLRQFLDAYDEAVQGPA